MRSFLFKSSLILIAITVLLIVGGLSLALFGPLLPGGVLFPIQYFAEQQIKRIISDPTSNSNFVLDLMERRIRDLNIRMGTKNETIALLYLDKVVSQATQAISLVPQNEADLLKERLLGLVRKADDTTKLLKLAPIENSTEYQAIQAIFATLLKGRELTAVKDNLHEPDLLIMPEYLDSNTNPTKRINSVRGLVPFPTGSAGAVHAFYPLTGEHTTQKCTTCHSNGKYSGTPNRCILCHALELPNPHYPGECGICHSAVAWTEIIFSHVKAVTVDCASCHEKDKPTNHYNGQCSACHITQDWTTVTFDHVTAGAVDCISCHANVKPANHYPGQCSNCHNTSIWSEARFNHAGFTDCISCHAGDSPANHYTGQCSNCHDPNSSWTNAHFNHSGFSDCISCHAGDAPGNHYSGQCSSCHDPNSNWKNASFNHNGLSDCTACHAGSAPANHFPGQCSNCHNTGGWGGAAFNHSGYTDCISCHSKDRPSEHDQGQCSECHNTQGWGDGGEGVGGLNLNMSGVLQAFSCSECHTTGVAEALKVVRQ